MYEDKTTDNIQNNLLSNISDDYEKTVGYPVYDTLKTAAIEMANVYKGLDDMLKKLDVNNLSGADLEKFIEQRTGLQRTPGNYASTVLTINGSCTINEGNLFETAGGIQYKAMETKEILDSGTVNIQALLIGSSGNTPANTITQIPVTIVGIVSVKNPDPVVNGYDSESDDNLRERYLERLQRPSTSGNKYDYVNWAKEVTGVGDVKVFPLWNGNGTVKVVITNQDKRAANEALVSTVQNYIENIMPVCVALTVAPAVEKAIDITAKVVLASGYTIQQAQNNFNTNMQKYLSDQAFNSTYISYAKVGGILLSTDGIVDYNNLTLNGGTVNVALADEEIPVAGTISLGV
jgi:uncharacterized phage protein gp47/JayE